MPLTKPKQTDQAEYEPSPHRPSSERSNAQLAKKLVVNEIDLGAILAMDEPDSTSPPVQLNERQPHANYKDKKNQLCL